MEGRKLIFVGVAFGSVKKQIDKFINFIHLKG